MGKGRLSHQRVKVLKSASIYINFRPPNSNVLETRTGLTVIPKAWSSPKQRAKGNLVEQH